MTAGVSIAVVTLYCNYHITKVSSKGDALERTNKELGTHVSVHTQTQRGHNTENLPQTKMYFGGLRRKPHLQPGDKQGRVLPQERQRAQRQQQTLLVHLQNKHKKLLPVRK